MNPNFSSKPEWRQEIKQRLATLDESAYLSANQQIVRQFWDCKWIQRACTIMIYYSIGREAATPQLILELLRMGKRVALPVCTPERNLEAKAIQTLADLERTGRLGLYEPGSDAPLVAAAELDLIVIPAVAFDRQGNRLGHGMGYYDRYLNNPGITGLKVGLAYDFQVVEKLPVQAHDVKMDGLITPSRVWDFNQKADGSH